VTHGQPSQSLGDAVDRRVRRVVCVAANASVDKIAAVERLVPGEIHRPQMLSVVPGGKAVNVARAAMRLGLETVVVPLVAGHTGAWLIEALAAEGMAAQPVLIGGETRSCLTILDRSTGRLTELYEPGPPVDAAGWASLEAAVGAALADDGAHAVVVMSGSLLPGAPPDGYARIVVLARMAGARAVVDADGEVLGRALAARPWLVRVNAAEAARATGLRSGGEAEALAAARALRAGGAGNALVTRGVDGALLVDEDDSAWRLGQPVERGEYPVGSGDSGLAGFLAGISAGHPASEAARWAIGAGVANALHAGQGAVDPRDVWRIRQQVSLTRITTDPAGAATAASPKVSIAGSQMP
jgi:1-phosphofructokinase family hexose kinase